jgi:hypothetical protein
MTKRTPKNGNHEGLVKMTVEVTPELAKQFRVYAAYTGIPHYQLSIQVFSEYFVNHPIHTPLK